MESHLHNNKIAPIAQVPHSQRIEYILFPAPIFGINTVNSSWELVFYLRVWNLIPQPNTGVKITKRLLSRYCHVIRDRFKCAGIKISRRLSIFKILTIIHAQGVQAIPGVHLASFFYDLHISTAVQQ